MKNAFFYAFGCEKSKDAKRMTQTIAYYNHNGFLMARFVTDDNIPTINKADDTAKRW